MITTAYQCKLLELNHSRSHGQSTWLKQSSNLKILVRHKISISWCEGSNLYRQFTSVKNLCLPRFGSDITKPSGVCVCVPRLEKFGNKSISQLKIFRWCWLRACWKRNLKAFLKKSKKIQNFIFLGAWDRISLFGHFGPKSRF